MTALSLNTHPIPDDQDHTHRVPIFIWYLVSLAFSFVIAVVLFLLVGLALFHFVIDDTAYAPGYSERSFRSIEVGMSKAEVLDRLGPPLGSTMAPQEPLDGLIWRYTWSPHDGSHYQRFLRFSADETVKSVHSEFYFD